MEQEFIIPSQSNLPLYIKSNSAPDAERSVDWHYHEDVEMVLVEQGEFRLFINNQAYDLYAGDIVLVNSFVPHKTLTPIGNKKLLLQFKHNLFANEQNSLSALMPFYPKHSDFVIFKKGSRQNECLSACFEKLSGEFLTQERAYTSFIKAAFYEILAILYRFEILDNPEELRLPPECERFLPALQYVYDNISLPVSLGEISNMLNIDRSYFCRLFKKTMNMPFMEYVCALRLSKAEELLLHSDRSITEIAIECGFSSPAYFTKIFREKKGYTPSFYKQLQKR